ncbi:MAG TPA: 2-oxoglutarate dehydrogenase, E2 component, dihydrolipoamide succinyltransferase [Streptosporangiaceae bacterium]|nr:2-oxoglutarate dehydrogenase, E2 component, dihydrolipoamide succinyltransferase [Streptosporangiaceae bacterium]
MSVSVSMPQLGESVTEGTVTRWLKHEGDHVSADEPLLEVSTDKVDTEIPSPVSGILRGITVAEDETVAVGAELAVIDEDGAAGGQDSAPAGAQQPQDQYQQPQYQQPQYQDARPQQAQYEQPYQQPPQEQPAYQQPAYEQPAYEQPSYQPPQYAEPEQGAAGYQPATGYEPPPSYADQGQQGEYQQYAGQPASYQVPPPPAAAPPAPAAAAPAPAPPAAPAATSPAAPPPAAPAPQPPPDQGAPAPPAPAEAGQPTAEAGESPYVTPLVRKLAAEHDIDLGSITGTGVGGRIRKQDVLDAASQRRGGEAPRPAAAAAPAPAAPAPDAAPAGPQAQAAPSAQAPAPPAPKTIPAPSTLRGTTERLSRARHVIAQRMVESLQTSAQLTTVVEADVTAIARLRERIKSAFEAREGVKLSFLPFFALATVEALKAHPKLNAVIDTANGTMTYHDAEHLGIAVDTERGLMVPVIRNAGDLNIGGLARKIADLAQRTRGGQVSPDDLSGGTFTLTNTGSRGALFDTPIINQPQVGILGTGTVSKRPVVVDDPDLGEVITVRSIVYLALTYDHRLVDGADAARFLATIKNRLEEGAFEAEFGR